MADRKFQIEVSTSFNPAGSQQANDSLNNIGKSTEKAGEKAKEFNVHGREMRRLFGEIDRISPGLGESLKALFEPEVAGVIAVVVGLELLAKAYENHKKHLEEIQAEAAAVWVAQRDAMSDATKSAEDYAASLRKVNDASKDTEANLKSTLTILQAQIDARKKTIDLIEQEQLANAQGDKDREQAIKRRFDDIKREYDLTAESIALEKKRDDLTERQSVLRPKLKEASDQAAADLEEEIGSQDAAAAAGRMKGKDFDKLKTIVDEASETLRKYRDEGSVSFHSAYRAQETLDQYGPVFEQYKKDADTVARHTAAVEHLTKAQQQASNTYKENEDAIKSETQEVTTGESVLSIHRTSSRRARDAGLIDAAGGTDAALAGGLSALDTLYQGKKLDAKGQQQYSAMAAVFDQVDGHFDRVLQLLFKLHQRGASNEQKLQLLEASVRNLQSAQMKGSTTGQ